MDFWVVHDRNGHFWHYYGVLSFQCSLHRDDSFPFLDYSSFSSLLCLTCSCIHIQIRRQRMIQPGEGFHDLVTAQSRPRNIALSLAKKVSCRHTRFTSLVHMRHRELIRKRVKRRAAINKVAMMPMVKFCGDPRKRHSSSINSQRLTNNHKQFKRLHYGGHGEARGFDGLLNEKHCSG
jgi:hypothetical protein